MDTQNNALQTASLVGRLQESFGIGGDNRAAELDLTRLRYVIYARKSTDSSEKQERSIPDQLHTCRELADRLGVKVVDRIHEEQSAKLSDKRPKFREMLDGIVNGKYDGIIVWSPDRLARNMKEAGEIIDLLDRGVIKDLKFANNFVFANEPSGKMLLGISFVMAKQYSDQHGQNVDRAIRRKTSEGKYAGSHTKHGYYKDGAHYLRPDGENFGLISEVFAMRLRKCSLADIAAWLREQGYPRKTKHTAERKLVISVKFISDLLRDPVYAGAMVFGKQVINLFEKYDFVSMISAEDFDKLCKQGGLTKGFTLTNIIKKPGDIKADLMREMVTCAGCNRHMSTGITTNSRKTTNYFYFRCDTPTCERFRKSVRAKVIIQAIYDFLEKHPLATKESYDHYVPEMKRITELQSKDTESTLRSLSLQLQHVAERITEAKREVRDEEDATLKKAFKQDLKEQLEKAQKLEAQIKKLKQTRERTNDIILTYESFIELFQNLAKVIRNTESMSYLDFIIKKLFSNFVTDGKKVLQITQNSPFRELCGSPNPADSVMVAPRGIEPLFSP